jgi:hypothetical protein
MKYLQIIFLFCLLHACQPNKNSAHFAHTIEIEQDSLIQFNIGDTISEAWLKNTITRLLNKLGSTAKNINLDSVQDFIGDAETQFYEAQTDTLIYIFSTDTSDMYLGDTNNTKIFFRVPELSKKRIQAYRSIEYHNMSIFTEKEEEDSKIQLWFSVQDVGIRSFEKISANTWVVVGAENSDTIRKYVNPVW